MKEAFSLLESLIYILCIVILTNLFCSFFSDFQIKTNLYVDNSQTYISQVKAGLFLLDDLENVNLGNVKEITANKIIWTKDGQDWCWIFNNNKLFRISGKYDKNTGLWSNKHSSLVATNLQAVTFKLIFSKKIIVGFRVQFKDINNKLILDNYVALKKIIL